MQGYKIDFAVPCRLPGEFIQSGPLRYEGLLTGKLVYQNRVKQFNPLFQF